MIVLEYSIPEMNEVYRMIPDTPTMTVPLRTDEHGAIRIGKTRVLLELVIHAYYMGETEQILRDLEANLTPEARALRTRLRAYQEQQQNSQ